VFRNFKKMSGSKTVRFHHRVSCTLRADGYIYMNSFSREKRKPGYYGTGPFARISIESTADELGNEIMSVKTGCSIVDDIGDPVAAIMPLYDLAGVSDHRVFYKNSKTVNISFKAEEITLRAFRSVRGQSVSVPEAHQDVAIDISPEALGKAVVSVFDKVERCV